MAIHDQLQIHRTGIKLLALAVRVQEQLPRSVKKILGAQIMQCCVDMLALMALANALRRLGACKADEFDQINSYFGLLRQSPASHHLRAKLANAARDRGYCVNGSLTKVFRRTGAAA